MKYQKTLVLLFLCILGLVFSENKQDKKNGGEMYRSSGLGKFFKIKNY